MEPAAVTCLLLTIAKLLLTITKFLLTTSFAVHTPVGPIDSIITDAACITSIHRR
jgi:hypothetical protein